MRYGTIVRWDPQKKFGFIQPDQGPDVFFHISALGACSEPRIEIGQPVKYEIDPKTLPKRVSRADYDPEKKATEKPISSAAMMVELIDKIPGGLVQEAEEARVAHHPNARRKKPTWRR